MTSYDAPHQVNNAKKMLAYYAKEREMLRKKLQRARTADEQLGKLEAAVAGTEGCTCHLKFSVSSARRGRLAR